MRFAGSPMSSAPRRRKKRRIIVFLLLPIIMISALFWVSSAKIRPIVVQVGMGAISDIVADTINDEISSMMNEGSLDYNELVSLQKDKNGSITALVTNMARINLLQTEICGAVIEAFSGDEPTVVRIPLGNVLGGTLLSGRGPMIPVRVMSVTNVSTGFSNEFSSAGINQTRHQIVLNVEVVLTIFVPGGTEEMVIDSDINVAETIIVGNVPNSYAEIG